jgi:hypothetical protein
MRELPYPPQAEKTLNLHTLTEHLTLRRIEQLTLIESSTYSKPASELEVQILTNLKMTQKLH